MVKYFEVSFINSWIGWDVTAYDADGYMVEELNGWSLPEYQYLKRDAVARAKDLAASVGVSDIRVAKRKDGGWYPEGMKA